MNNDYCEYEELPRYNPVEDYYSPLNVLEDLIDILKEKNQYGIIKEIIKHKDCPQHIYNLGANLFDMRRIDEC